MAVHLATCFLHIPEYVNVIHITHPGIMFWH